MSEVSKQIQIQESASERRLQEIRDRLKRLPDAPWSVEAVRPSHEDEARVYDRHHYGVCKPTPNNPGYRRPIAEFIAHAREDVPYLLDLLDSLSQQRDEWQQQMQHERDRRFENLADAINEAVGFLKSVEWDTDATADAACDIRLELEATFAALAESAEAQRDECQQEIARVQTTTEGEVDG